MDNLCATCHAISWDDIPPFPEDLYIRISSGYDHFQYLNRKPIRPGEPLGTKHHESLENLRHAAAQGCGLCELIEHQVDVLLSELETLGQPRSRYYDNIHPQFDLWLVKRPDKADGVWVLTNSTWHPGQWVLLLAAVAFCAEEDDPLANVFSSRLVNEVPSEAALDRIDRWVASCDHHSGCLHGEKTMPTRVIDVGPSGSKDVVKLIDISDDMQDSYVALSYCWGVGKKEYVTVKANLAKRENEGFETRILPRTVRDTIELARRLRIKYLWVDGICICQDDAADWERESKVMGRVYANAYLTISATGVDDSEGGLFFPRTARKTLRLPFTVQNTTGTVVMSSLPLNKELFKKFHVEMFNEPLIDRAWCFQERVLSRRILHFTRAQMYFECLQGTLGEDGLTLPYRSTHAGKEADSLSAHRENSPRNTEDILSQWQDLLHRYGARKLTYSSDKLPALSGIAELYQKLLDDEYLAGMWKGTLIEGLCWTSPQSPQRSDLAAAEYLAPSWSWAAVDGFSWHGLKRPWTPMATIGDTHVGLDGVNPFGRVKDAWIKLSAPLIPLTLSNAQIPEISNGELVVHCADGDKEAMRISFDTIDISNDAAVEKLRSMQLYSLVLARVRPSDPNEMDGDRSLIVIPVCGEKMKRVGHTSHLYTRELGEKKAVVLI